MTDFEVFLVVIYVFIGFILFLIFMKTGKHTFLQSLFLGFAWIIGAVVVVFFAIFTKKSHIGRNHMIPTISNKRRKDD